jgi:hypothetical protein
MIMMPVNGYLLKKLYHKRVIRWKIPKIKMF